MMKLPTVALGLGLLALSLAACKGEEKEKAATTTPVAAPKPAASAAASAAKPAEEPKEEAEPEAKKDESGIPDIPSGRSKPPTIAEWKDATEVNTQGANSRPPDCHMKIVREWLKVNCSADDVTGEISKQEGFGNENADYFKSIKPGKHVDFVMRLRKGTVQKVRIHREDGKYASLFVNWPGADEKPKHVALGVGGG